MHLSIKKNLNTCYVKEIIISSLQFKQYNKMNGKKLQKGKEQLKDVCIVKII